jgi:hypothetical protein
VKVTLKAAHTHAGATVGPGPVDLPALDALWLRGLDLIEESEQSILAELKKLGIKAPAAADTAPPAEPPPETKQ